MKSNTDLERVPVQVRFPFWFPSSGSQFGSLCRVRVLGRTQNPNRKPNWNRNRNPNLELELGTGTWNWNWNLEP